jgi:hypothetical protein
VLAVYARLRFTPYHCRLNDYATKEPRWSECRYRRLFFVGDSTFGILTSGLNDAWGTAAAACAERPRALIHVALKGLFKRRYGSIYLPERHYVKGSIASQITRIITEKAGSAPLSPDDDVIVLSLGFWEAAYGTLLEMPENLAELLATLRDRYSGVRIVFTPSTTCDEMKIVSGVVFSDDKMMTQWRVLLANRIAMAAVRAAGHEVVDRYAPTAGMREAATDGWHFKTKVVGGAMANVVLNHVCNP